MNNPATLTGLTNRGWTGDATVGQTRLDEAWRALQLELPSLVAWITAGRIPSDSAADVVSAAALRVLRNPEGYVEGSGSVDDYRESWKRANSTEDIYFTAAERRRLSPPDYGAGSVSFGPATYGRC